MIKNPDSRLVTAFESFSEYGSIAIIFSVSLVIIGWIFDIPVLKNICPNLLSMKVNTAGPFIFVGVSLYLLQKKRSDQRTRYIAHGCAFIVTMIGLLPLTEYLFGWEMGIDTLLFKEPPLTAGTFHSGRMALNTALAFLINGISISLIDIEVRGKYRPSEFLSSTAALIPLTALIGNMYGAYGLFGIGQYTKMALHTSIIFLMVHACILFARPDRGLMALLTSENAGGILARRLVFTSIGVPPLLGLLILIGKRVELYDAEYGIALLVMSSSIVTTALVWLSSFLVDRKDKERKLVMEDLRKYRDLLEVTVNERTAELKSSNVELEAFCYSVSHDLRTPLRAIDGFSRIVLDEYANKLDDEGKRLLNVVRSSTQKMGQLIDDLLALSRTGRKEMTMTEIDMEKLTNSVVEEIKPATVGRIPHIEIKTLPAATGDLVLLKQVLVNLLSNAIKFTGRKENAAIVVGGRTEDHENMYYIKDNGAGFDMQYAHKLFGVFQRLHTGDEFDGTGIGLAIVKRIIIRHGGRVWAEGKVNEGATFSFALPRKK